LTGYAELANAWTITTNPEDVIKKAESAISLGYNEVQFHSASPSEEDFLNVCHEAGTPAS